MRSRVFLALGREAAVARQPGRGALSRRRVPAPSPSPDALELVLLLTDSDPARCRRAALRWHGRYTREHRDVDTDEAQAVLALLAMLTGPRARQAAMALAEILERPGLRSAQEALVRWARGEAEPPR